MVFDKLLSATGTGEIADIFTIIDSKAKKSPNIGEMLIMRPDGSIEGNMNDSVIEKIQNITKQTEWTKPLSIWIANEKGDEYRVFWDRISNKFRAVVLGGGHISQPLVQILSLLEFEVTVIDDRPDFANQARFPGANQVICQNFCLALKDIVITNDTAIIIVTRGHRYDMDCLRATMGSNARYLGMIGSKKRIKEIINLFRDEGISETIQGKLRAPIGLDIKAQTPSEIALSIAAEIIAIFRGGSFLPLSICKGGSK